MVDMKNNTGPTLGDVFRKAAEVQRERGHCKGELEDTDGRVCLYGATLVAFQEIEMPGPITPVLEYLDALVPAFDASSSDPASVWNDKPNRTATEVEKFLLFAADRADFGADS